MWPDYLLNKYLIAVKRLYILLQTCKSHKVITTAQLTIFMDLFVLTSCPFCLLLSRSSAARARSIVRRPRKQLNVKIARNASMRLA